METVGETTGLRSGARKTRQKRYKTLGKKEVNLHDVSLNLSSKEKLFQLWKSAHDHSRLFLSIDKDKRNKCFPFLLFTAILVGVMGG